MSKTKAELSKMTKKNVLLHIENMQLMLENDHLETQKENPGSAAHVAGGGCCPLHPAEGASTEDSDTVKTKSASFPGYVLLNMLGGFTLAVGHTRNFLLCRKSNCSHEDACS